MEVSTAWMVFFGQQTGTSVNELALRVWQDCQELEDQSDAGEELQAASLKLLVECLDSKAGQEVVLQFVQALQALAVSLVMTGTTLTDQCCFVRVANDAHLNGILLDHISSPCNMHMSEQLQGFAHPRKGRVSTSMCLSLHMSVSSSVWECFTIPYSQQ